MEQAYKFSKKTTLPYTILEKICKLNKLMVLSKKKGEPKPSPEILHCIKD